MMKDQYNSRRWNSRHVYRRRRGRAVRIGEIVKGVFESTILQQQDQLREVRNNWDELLPVGLSSHCRIVGLSGTVLGVEAESALYAGELRLCRAALLQELRGRCRRAKITAIKLIITGERWL